jgi:uroporphyrinogen decarboxylase
MTKSKLILRALAGETLPTPPIWMMRQPVSETRRITQA